MEKKPLFPSEGTDAEKGALVSRLLLLSSDEAQIWLNFQISACEDVLCWGSFVSVVFVLHSIFMMIIMSKLQCLSSASATAWRTHSKLLGNGYHGATASRNAKREFCSAQDVEDVQGSVGRGVPLPEGLLGPVCLCHHLKVK